MTDPAYAAKVRRSHWLITATIGWAWLAVPLGILAALAPLILSPADQRTFISFLIFGTITVGFGVFSGNAGVLSFGHAAFVAVGAYAGAILVMAPSARTSMLPALPDFMATLEVSVPVALALSAIICGLLAILPGVVIARMTPAVAVIGTFALLVIINDVLIGAKDITRGNQTFYGVPPIATLTTSVVVLLGVILIARIYRDSPMGIRLRASREDVMAARVAGIAVERQRFVAWVLSAMICGVGGALFGAFIGAFSPKTFYLVLSLQLLAMLLVGGWTTVSGAVVGTAVVVIMTSMLDRVSGGIGPIPPFPGLTEIGVSVAILVILFFRRNGIMGLQELDERVGEWLGKRSRKRRTAGAVSTSPHPDAVVGPVPPDALARQNITLAVAGIEKAFSGVSVLRGVDLSIDTGEIVGIIGPNGSGKTTLVNIITGLVKPDNGTVTVNGHDITAAAPRKVSREGLARTFQGIKVFKALSTSLNIRAVARRSGGTVTEAESLALLRSVGLEGLERRPAGTLPYGAQRRLEIARALAANPSFLLLDEPAAGLNEDESDELMALLVRIRSERHVGVMLIDHDLRLMLRTCDRIVVINEGRVIANGKPADIRVDPRVISAYLGSKYETEGVSTAGSDQ